MQVRFSALADRDVDEILAYYGAPSAVADRFGSQINAAVRHLVQWPHTAVRRRDLTRHRVLFWPTQPYWLVLQKNGPNLTVIAVLHGSRKLSRAISQRLRQDF